MWSIWHSGLVHADCKAIGKMPRGNAVRGMYLTIQLDTSNCSSYVEGTMRNTRIKSRKILENRPGAVVPTDVAELDVTSVGGARYSVMFSDEPSGNRVACHMKTNRKNSQIVKAAYLVGRTANGLHGEEEYYQLQKIIYEGFKGVTSGQNPDLYNSMLHS